MENDSENKSKLINLSNSIFRESALIGSINLDCLTFHSTFNFQSPVLIVSMTIQFSFVESIHNLIRVFQLLEATFSIHRFLDNHTTVYHFAGIHDWLSSFPFKQVVYFAKIFTLRHKWNLWISPKTRKVNFLSVKTLKSWGHLCHYPMC